MPVDSAKDVSAVAAHRHVPTPYEEQRAQLEKLLKDPSKPVIIPQGPGEKSIRPPREMMKNVQGSSAGAGSGEFHVYKQSRRREYERIKIMEEQSKKEVAMREFEKKRLQQQAEADAKTAKNRAKRQKRKERAKRAKSDESEEQPTSDFAVQGPEAKKRRLLDAGLHHLQTPGLHQEGDGNHRQQSMDDMPEALEQNPASLEEGTVVIVDDP